MSHLTLNEQIYMIAIWHMRQDAYGVKIREKIIDLTGKSMDFGTLYNNMNQLVKKGYVVTQKGEAAPNRGGNIKVYYSLTKLGRQALEESRSIQESLWLDVPRNAFI